MTPQEALAKVDGWVRVYKNAPNRCVDWYEKDGEALAVLRSVVEDYERARPLLEAVRKAEIFHYKDGSRGFEVDMDMDHPILQGALAYREGKV